MDKSAEIWINTLQLLEHPEGGYYRETYRADEVIPDEYLPDRYSFANNQNNNGKSSH